MENKNEVAAATKTHSERFMNAVITELANTGDSVKLSDFQKKMIQKYFIKMDAVLKSAEQKRQSKSENNREPIEYSWGNINMEKFALDVVDFASVGLDPLQRNHVALIPFANARTKKYDVTLIPEYRGLEIKAMKYALDPPKKVTVELVYSNDIFTEIKQDAENAVESYTFKIVNSFDRGELRGGFYYLKFDDETKNRVVTMSKDAIEKRKPKYASAEFWGGEKDEWKDGKKTGKKEIIPGWHDEMAYKTVCRAAYGSITVDSEKIDRHYATVTQIDKETHFDSYEVVEEKKKALAEKGNTETPELP